MNKIKITNCKNELKFDYYVTDDGRVWSERSKKFMAKTLDRYGYEKVCLMSPEGRHRHSVHRLILENFNPVPGMDKLQVNHIDGNKQNNNLSNLEWCTPAENIHHAMEHNLRAKINGSAKLTPEQVLEICHLLKDKTMTQKQIAEKYGVHVCSIERIKAKKLWKSITENFDFT